MKIAEINELYREMGIGSEEERRKYTDWTESVQENKNEYIFIRYSPSSSLEQEKKNKAENEPNESNGI